MKPVLALIALAVMFLSMFAHPVLSNATVLKEKHPLQPAHELPVLEGPATSNIDEK